MTLPDLNPVTTSQSYETAKRRLDKELSDKELVNRLALKIIQFAVDNQIPYQVLSNACDAAKLAISPLR